MKQKLSVAEWCDEQVKAGKEITLKWEGGGDSGWVYFEIDGEQVENEYTESLVSYCYDVLDYGSWAGEFDANGEAVYDPNQKAFVGIDYYSETDIDERDPGIVLSIPKDLWFDGLSVEVEEVEYEVSAHNVDVKLLVQNGMVINKHNEVAEELKKQIVEQLNNDFMPKVGDDSGVFADMTLLANDFETDPKTGNKTAKMDRVNVRFREIEEKEIFIETADIELLEKK